ncbi:MAG TPA: hypothetical protein PLJ47_05820 [Candidatus Hydrogenedentes bacterium]|nr:hypothetical protein [Candidatus Hydrogenedentota bacterium]HRK34095.1 hypothetical protein [Candidatus Hydrogenedentota bacterium]
MEEVTPPQRSLDPHIEDFALAFIVKDKQKKFLQLLEAATAERATPRTMEKLGAYLDQVLVNELDQRYCRELSHHEDVGFHTLGELPQVISNVLTDVPDQLCYVISASHPMRFQLVDLFDALAATRSGDLITGGDGTVYSCIPGKLALYEPEVGYRILCKRD